MFTVSYIELVAEINEYHDLTPTVVPDDLSHVMIHGKYMYYSDDPNYPKVGSESILYTLSLYCILSVYTVLYTLSLYCILSVYTVYSQSILYTLSLYCIYFQVGDVRVAFSYAGLCKDSKLGQAQLVRVLSSCSVTNMYCSSMFTNGRSPVA